MGKKDKEFLGKINSDRKIHNRTERGKKKMGRGNGKFGKY